MSRAHPAAPAAAGAPAPFVRNHRILFDCTETTRSRANTGIQRAVRSIVAAASSALPEGIESVAIAFDGRHFVALEGTALDTHAASAARPPLRERLRTLVTRGYRNPALRVTLLHPRVLSALRQSFSALRWTLKRWRGAFARPGGGIDYRPGDWIVLVDSNWGPDLTVELKRAKAAGARACVVIYDLIQIRHADLVSPGAGAIYQRWFARTVPLADRIMTISRAVRDDVLAYLRQRPGFSAHGDATVGWFHLGSEFDQASGGRAPSAEVATLFGPDYPPTFLVVGTLEQRKGQASVLDAFEQRWAAGDPARLVLVGREGWGSHALTQRLVRHPERGERLIWLAHASDADLEHCYRHACALVIASTSEGFGLPIAEALQRGVPVIATDIPVFREVGGDAITYVPPLEPAALARAVADAERATARSPSPRAAARPWKESARALVRQLVDPDL